VEVKKDSIYKLVNEVGNVNADTEITFEFGTRSDITFDLASIPFQAQIIYKRLNGTRCIRVITSQRPLTIERAASERDVDVAVIGVFVSKKIAQLVQEGKYNAAHLTAVSHKEMLERSAHTSEQRHLYQQFLAQLKQCETELNHATAQEKLQGLSVSAMDELSDGVSAARSRARSDRTAAKMYQVKGSQANACVVQ